MIRKDLREHCRRTVLPRLLEETDIVAFCKACGFSPYPYQIDAMTNPAQRLILLWGRRCGKTATCALLALWHCMFKGDNAIIVSYNQEQAKIMMSEIRKWYRNYKYKNPESEFIALKRDSSRDIVFAKSGGHIMCRPAGPGIRGYQANIIIIDEAAQVPDSLIQEEITPLAAVLEPGKQRKILMISTPHSRGTAFYDCWRNRDVWTVLGPIKTESCPNADLEYLAAERENMPESVYKQEYEAEWMDTQSNVFSIHDIEACMYPPHEKLPAPKYCVMGVDLARIVDYTVITVLSDDGYVMHIENMQRTPYEVVAARAAELSHKYNVARTLVDSTGLGDPVLNEIFRREKIKGVLEGFVFSNKSKLSLINNLRSVFERRAIHIPHPDHSPAARKLYYELLAFRYEETKITKTLRVAAPQRKHDDHVISLALAADNLRPHDRITFLKPQEW